MPRVFAGILRLIEAIYPLRFISGFYVFNFGQFSFPLVSLFFFVAVAVAEIV